VEKVEIMSIASRPLAGIRLIGSALLMALAMPADPARAAGAVLVMNSSAASLSVVDMASQTEIRRIPVLREPHHFTLTPDKREVLVGDTVGNEILFLDPATFELRRRLPISDPYQLGFSPDGRFLVVAAIARNQVDVYEAGTYKLVKRFQVSSMPSHMDFLPDSSQVFISLQGTGKVAAFDLKAMAPLWTADVGKAPAGVMVHGAQLLVANMGADDVSVLDIRTGRPIQRIHTGRGAHQLFWSPDRKLIYVNNRIDSTSVVLDAATLKVGRSYKLPGGPDDMEFAPDGHIWFTMRFAHKLAVMDPATGDYTTIEVGRSPHGIFLNPKAVASK
jgi:DNA-binding beta-propeller fold protein YncE